MYMYIIFYVHSTLVRQIPVAILKCYSCTTLNICLVCVVLENEITGCGNSIDMWSE